MKKLFYHYRFSPFNYKSNLPTLDFGWLNLAIILSIIAYIMGLGSIKPNSILGTIYVLISTLFYIPYIFLFVFSIMFRRLRTLNRSLFLILILILPIGGYLILMLILSRRTEVEEKEYKENIRVRKAKHNKLKFAVNNKEISENYINDKVENKQVSKGITKIESATISEKNEKPIYQSKKMESKKNYYMDENEEYTIDPIYALADAINISQNKYIVDVNLLNKVYGIKLSNKENEDIKSFEVITEDPDKIIKMQDFIKANISDFQAQNVMLDLETSGFLSQNAKMIEFSFIFFDNNLNIVNTYSALVNPRFPVEAKITDITGITNDQLAQAQYEEYFIELFKMVLQNRYVYGHNVKAFDLKFFENIFGEGYDSLNIKAIDTLEEARISLSADNYKLATLVKKYEIKNLSTHRAEADSLATLGLLEVILKSGNASDKLKKLSLHVDSFSPDGLKEDPKDEIISNAKQLLSESLVNHTICLSGKFTPSKAEITKIIESHGGIVSNTITNKTTVLLFTEEYGNKVDIALSKNIPVISYQYLFENLVKGEDMVLLSSMSEGILSKTKRYED